MDTITNALPSQQLNDEWIEAFSTSLELDIVEDGDAALELAAERAQLECDRQALATLRAEMNQEREKLEEEHRQTVDDLRQRLSRVSRKLVIATKWLREAQLREKAGRGPSPVAALSAALAPAPPSKAAQPAAKPKAPASRAKAKAPRRRSIGRRRF